MGLTGHRRHLVQPLTLILLVVGLLAGCGSKTGLSEELVESDLIDAGVECEIPCPDSTFCHPTCLVDGECRPLPRPDCDDGDDCTEDRCDPELDRCVNELALDDLDGDGYQVPLECGGTDCDDADPEVHPGARERCNGLDDDCDGLIDEGADLVPWGEEVVVSASDETDDAASLVWTGESYVVGYWDYRGGDADVFIQRIDREGQRVGEEEQVTTSAGDGFGPSLVWTGRELGVVWDDRRDGNFEIYFARFDSELRRLTGDVRLTEDPAWSLYPQIVWSGREYLVVWQDERRGLFEVYAQRIGPEGPAGSNEPLSDPGDGQEAESPVVAFDGTSYHVAWLEGALDRLEVRMMRLDQLLRSQGTARLSNAASGSASAPSIAAGAGVVAVSWEQERALGWDTSVALLTAEGEPVGPPITIDEAHSNAREAVLLWENSGFLVVWSAFEDPSFNLYFSVLDPTGGVALPARELVRAPGDAVGAVVALGPGEVGVAWSDARSGTYDVLFTRLLCAGL